MMANWRTQTLLRMRGHATIFYFDFPLLCYDKVLNSSAEYVSTKLTFERKMPITKDIVR